jgi:hypothetical protein
LRHPMAKTEITLSMHAMLAKRNLSSLNLIIAGGRPPGASFDRFPKHII